MKKQKPVIISTVTTDSRRCCTYCNLRLIIGFKNPLIISLPLFNKVRLEGYLRKNSTEIVTVGQKSI